MLERSAAGPRRGPFVAPGRLRCGARPRVAPQNSLHSPCSFRSNNCGKSVYEERWARRPRPCAPRRSRNRPPPGTARRECGRLSFAKKSQFDPGHRLCSSREHRRRLRKGAFGQGGGRLFGGEERSAGVGARSALRELTRGICPSAAPERREASYAARPQGEHRNAVGRTRPTAEVKPSGLSGRAFALADRRSEGHQPARTSL